VFAGHGWVWPVLLVAATVHGICLVARRYRIPVLVTLVVAAIAAWLVIAWTIFGPFTHFGVPNSVTWSHFTSAITEAQRDFSGSLAPVSPTAGFRLLAAAGVAFVAFLGDWLTFGRRWVLFGAAPAFAMFVVCCMTGRGGGRALIIVIEVAFLTINLLVQNVWGPGASRLWFAGNRAGATAWAVRAGGIAGALALLGAIVVAPFVSGEEGAGILGWRSGLGIAGGGPRIVANPIVNLSTRLLQLSNTPVFTVKSTVSSYWRLTALDTFTGDTWTASSSYGGFGTNLPGSSDVPTGTRKVVEQFQIQDLDSPWLPVAFNPVSVVGVRNVSYDQSSDSLITSKPTSNGLSYEVTSYQYLSTVNSADLQRARKLGNLSSLSKYLALPDSVSPQVYALAKQITAGKTTEYDKAIALQDYLRSPPFQYSLYPPFDGAGNAALNNFLFSTKQGYCQQFAGAYAVLARAAGLPTRLAVGFATGTAEGNDTFQVLDSDAHTWPEVYFGPNYGWLPFEPTPGFASPGTSHYDPTPGTAEGNPSSATGNRNTPHGSTGPTTTFPSGTTLPANSASGSGSGHHASNLLVDLLPVLAIVGAIAGWIALNVGSRRLRWTLRRKRSGRSGADGQILSRWADASELLAWRGVPRRPDETFDEYARRVGGGFGSQAKGPPPDVGGDVARLARLARMAAFAPEVDQTAADEAADVASRVHTRLLRTADLRQMLAWLFLPRPGRHRPFRQA
jgi:transglutaminase-like putative cysteine protease